MNIITLNLSRQSDQWDQPHQACLTVDPLDWDLVKGPLKLEMTFTNGAAPTDDIIVLSPNINGTPLSSDALSGLKEEIESAISDMASKPPPRPRGNADTPAAEPSEHQQSEATYDTEAYTRHFVLWSRQNPATRNLLEAAGDPSNDKVYYLKMSDTGLSGPNSSSPLEN